MIYSEYASFDQISYRLVGDIEYGLLTKFSTLYNVSVHGALYPELTEYPPYGQVYINAYHAVSAGYDALVWQSGDFAEIYTVTPISILNADGTSAVKQHPVANNDLIQFTGGWDGKLAVSQLVQNDTGGLVDFAKSITVYPANTWVQTIPSGWTGQAIEVGAGTAFNKLGSISFKYTVTDAFDDVSNLANVVVEWFDGQSDRNNLAGTANAETIDFSSSAVGVGVHGLSGDDVLRGSQAADNLCGDDGADRIGGKDGNDIINGGNGNDTLFGDTGNDTLDGGADNDTLWGGEGNDIIRGGLGNDQVYGENGDDQVGGKAGNDAVRGGGGNDTIWGDEGNDALYGDAGNDNINGGAGDDFLTGGIGIDRLRGETGVDTFVFMRGEAQGDTILDFEGAGVIGGDKIEFRGYGAGASVHQVSGDTWQIDAAGISEIFKIAGVVNLAKVDFYFT